MFVYTVCKFSCGGGSAALIALLPNGIVAVVVLVVVVVKDDVVGFVFRSANISTAPWASRGEEEETGQQSCFVAPSVTIFHIYIINQLLNCPSSHLSAAAAMIDWC
ncbi:hypothetical protein Tsp_00585 [Trichinella spiralis]|uniref:hypothetical protein n=1 Tax=Trichinella spiralis TaxID=6334 RepID=UPI0001EFC041|nr:hypothetical protein Tsp_00585 [Trichinella spiralis]